MKTFKLVILFALGLLIFGSAGFFGYELFLKPGRLEKKEKAAEANAPAATPTPDPGSPELSRLKALRQSGKTLEARDGLIAWKGNYPSSPLLPEVKKELGAANMALLFQSTANPSIVTYTVVKGDSLAKIAAKQHSNAELIQKANQLPNINLQIGQVLLIPSLKARLELDRAAKTITLLDNGNFVKEYALLSAPIAPKVPENRNTKVLEKVASVGAKRVAFGDKAYVTAEKSILISQAPPIIPAPASTAAQNAATPEGSQAAGSGASSAPQLAGGYVLSAEDLQELFPLVSRNTPVIIH